MYRPHIYLTVKGYLLGRKSACSVTGRCRSHEVDLLTINKRHEDRERGMFNSTLKS